jgi:AraC-like DNA-binding protein
MLFNFNLKSSVLLIFFVHGIVFSILLLNKGIRNQNKASLWLSLFVFLCAMYISPFMLGYAGWYFSETYRDIMFFVPFQQLFLIGPIIFFYTQSQLNKSFRLSKRDIVHFLPAISYLIYSIIVFVTDKLILSEYFFYADGRDKDLDPWYQMIGLISMAFYLILSLRYYSIYKKISYQTVSFADSISFSWIKRFLLAFLIILVLRILFFILNPEWGEFGRKFWYYLCFSGLFYYISVSGYTNSVKTIIAFRPSLFSFEPDFFPQEKDKVKDETPLDKETVEIPDLDEWKTKVERLMKVEREFENPDLTLSDVSQILEANPKKMSQIINQGFKMNFNDFVNYYRTEAVIEKFKSGEHNLQNFLDIAFECGFNSKSTFNRAFKKQTLMTPKEYLKKDLSK